MRHYTRRALLCAVMAFACSMAYADWGRTKGSFSVSPRGAATYTIPIWTPPGPNGIQPALSLSYSSQSGNGLAGVGWNVDAVASIERCNRTKHQDGNAAAVELTMSDRFCIGGNRLRLQSGTYGAAGSVYFTELADYSRVTAYGSTGNGPTFFLVEAKNGLRYEYGNTPDSRVVLGGTVLRWMLNKVYDRNDPNYPNNYVVSYDNANGFAVPNTISWTPTSLGSSSYRYTAKFNYLTTRSDKDSYKGKVAGYDVTNSNRLQSIQIESNGSVIRKYLLTYDTAPVTFRSRLTSLKECADDSESNCFLPITFTYQAGVIGITPGSGSVPAGSSNGILRGRYDLNGDGKNDILYLSGGTCHVAFGANTGFTGPYNVGTTSCGIVDRFLPNGRDAIALTISGTRWIYRWDESTSAFVGYNTGVGGGENSSADYDGDGLADFVTNSFNQLFIRRNTSSSASPNPSFASSTFEAGKLPPSALGGTPRFSGIWTYFGSGLQRADLNGDGRQEIYGAIVVELPGGGAVGYMVTLQAWSGGYAIPSSSTWSAGSLATPAINVNGDSCTDRLRGSTILISQCSGISSTSISAPATPLQVLDWDGDGKTDILVNSGGNFSVYLSTGTNFTGPFSTSINSTGTFFPLDQDGDGQEDLIKVNGTGAINYWTHTDAGAAPTNSAPNIPDLLASATDGFGVAYQPVYISTSWGNYSVGDDTAYPLQKPKGPKIVVAEASASNGIGGTYKKTYHYSGARENSERDEFAGFQQIDETDTRNGLVTKTYFKQAFPLTGIVYKRELMQPGGVTPISRQTLTNAYATLDSSPNNQRYFPFVESFTATQYEVGGSYNGNPIRTVTGSHTYDNASGTLYDRTVTVTEPASGTNGAEPGGTWTARTYVPVLLNETSTWCIGRPQQTQQINSSSLTYGSAITRTTNTTWNSTSCRPTEIVDEPGNGTLQVTTAIGYDAFGNVNSTAVTGVGMATRTTSAQYVDGTYTTGLLPLSVTNALGQTTYTAWNQELAVPTSVTDPNGITTSWQYDSFGRRIREDRPDGTFSTWTISQCPGCSPSTQKTIVDRIDYGVGGVKAGGEFQYLDQFDRPVRDYVLRNDGLYNVVLHYFDALGNLSEEYLPFKSSDPAPGYLSFAYDLIRRPISVSRFASGSSSAVEISNISYEVLRTCFIDGLSRYECQIRNAAGQLARTMDHAGYSQSFDYDASGNLKSVVDSASNILQTSNYNSRGMLQGRTDLDMGAWGFTTNALGEVVAQVDPRSNYTQFTYDPLGRLTSRAIGSNTDYWTWGSTSSAKNIGQLESVSGPGYAESYTYDSVGRLTQTAVAADVTYHINYSYNSIGALDTLTYPTSTSGYRLKLQYDYQNGWLYQIKDFNSPGTVFWTANAFDARAEITEETLGNGIVTKREYDKVFGWLKSIKSGTGGTPNIQNLEYTWDVVGNLTSRKDLNQSNLTETFSYDDLYRLTASTLNGVPNLGLSYDSLGNITSKSDVGTYTYDSSKRHQVVSTSNGWSFSYDSAGNMTSGRGATITWTDFNYPASISNGADTATFSYTPNRQYWKQVSNYTAGGAATTIYIGGLLEKVTTSAGTDYRHMIRAGGATIIVSRQTSGTNSVHYVTSDHLGSSSAITNASGGVLVNSSFDAYGKRRGSNWSGNPSAGDWAAIAATTRRGYTDHTMLDNLGLIHMNGRVQDPVLGRFLSPDPYVTNPENTQNWNRYSYVDNNPLSAIDPSGFKKITILVGNCVQRGEMGSFALDFTFGASSDNGWSFDFGVGNSGYAARGPDLICSYREIVIDIPDIATAAPPDPTSLPETIRDSESSWLGVLAPAIDQYLREGRHVEATAMDHLKGAAIALYNLGHELSELSPGGKIVNAALGRKPIPLTAEQSQAAAAVEAGAAVVGALRTGATAAGRLAQRLPGALGRALRCCFVAGTLVATEFGLRPIEEIEIGDLVWARDEQTGETALKPVTNLIQHREREIWFLAFEIENPDGSRSIQEFETTDDHPWRSAEDEWVETHNLRAGMLVQRAEGVPARLVSIVNTQRMAPTYNLEVAEFHNFFAGEARLWVHNCPLEDAARAGAQSSANAGRLAKQLSSQEGMAELLSGGGKAIAGAGTNVPLRDAGRLVSQYGGKVDDWAKVTSTAPGHAQTHAYRNVVTGEVVELKSFVP